MGVRENKVEKYLNDEVVNLGGITRKWVSPGRAGVPDRICIIQGAVWLVEVKTLAGRLSPGQIREHDRLIEVGANVCSVCGTEGVDLFIRKLKESL